MTKAILKTLSRNSILVGSAAHSDRFNDLDLLIPETFWDEAKRIFSALHPTSAFPMNAKTFDTDPPIEVFAVWYGPSFEDIPESELVDRTVLGVTFRAWTKAQDARE